MQHPEFQASTVLTHPAAPGVVFSFQNHAWKSTDSGQTWTSLGPPSFCCWYDGDLVLDPANANIMYAAATGSNQIADGIYKSIDGGANWTPVNSGLPASPRFHTLAVDPNNGSVLFAGTQGTNITGLPVDSGIYRTVNGGASWSKLTNGLPAQLKPSQILVHPQQGNIVYASAVGFNNQQGGVYKSVDGGDHWTQLFQENVFAIAVDPTDANIVYAGTWNTSGFYRSLDGGATWSPFNAGLPQSLPIDAIALDPANPRHVFIGSSAGVYEATFGDRRSTGPLLTPAANPSRLSFGTLGVGAVRQQVVQITGVGRLLSSEFNGFVGPNASEFQLNLNSCTNNISEGNSCSVFVSFAPTSEGQKSATLELRFAPGPSPLRILISGTGMSAVNRVIGRVTNGFNSGPVPNTNVTVYNAAGTQVIASAVTDADGTYFTGDLPGGSYRAKTDAAPVFNDQLFNSISCALGCNIAQGTAITLPMTGVTTTSVDFTIFRKTSIAGTISATDSPALAGITVQLRDGSNTIVRNTTTDASGHYQFVDVNESYYNVVTVNPLGYLDTSAFLLSTNPAATQDFVLPLNTPVGSNRNVSPPRGDGSTPVSVRFYNVTTAGKTTLSQTFDPLTLPDGYSAGFPPRTYTLATTAAFTVGVTTCINWGSDSFSDPTHARVLQSVGGVWHDVTSQLDPSSHLVCGVAESLGPFTVAETASTQLPPLACAVEPLLYSISGANLIYVPFVNGPTGTINVYWIDYFARREFWFTLGANSSFTQGTYATHPWLITDALGACRAIYVILPIAAQSIVVP